MRKLFCWVLLGLSAAGAWAAPEAAVRQVFRPERLEAGGHAYTVTCVSVGNPHCVVTGREVTEAEAREHGPVLECDAHFPRRVNVQLMRPVDGHTIELEIWERGAGYTLASGTSATACAAVAVRLGLCHSPVTVKMPGGSLEISLDSHFSATLTGPVECVYEAELFLESPASAPPPSP